LLATVVTLLSVSHRNIVPILFAPVFIMVRRCGDGLLAQVSRLLSGFLLLSSPLCHGSMVDEYFYVQDLNTNIHHHVQEYLATSGTQPNFLYDPNYPTGRIVEFYAHWCPHCQVRKEQPSKGRIITNYLYQFCTL
jgi:hypothetical protein